MLHFVAFEPVAVFRSASLGVQETHTFGNRAVLLPLNEFLVRTQCGSVKNAVMTLTIYARSRSSSSPPLSPLGILIYHK